MTERCGVSFPLIFRDVYGFCTVTPVGVRRVAALAAGLRRGTHNPRGLRRRASFVLPLLSCHFVAPQGVTSNAASRNSSKSYMIGALDPCSRAPRGAVGTSLVSAMRRFGSFWLDIANQCLRHGEARVALTPKAFGVLRYLVEHAGRLVTQDELLEALWPATYVSPAVLRKYILEIRRVLGDRSDKPIFIETLPKRGYQFVASVTDESAAGTSSAAGTKRIVGREPQLADLRGYLSRARRGERQIVFITGEPGIGKTSLADEFQGRVRFDTPTILIARGQCVEGYGGMEAYYSVLEALGQLCQGAEGESVVQVLSKQAPTWLVQFPALVTSKQREALQREILGATRERMLREIGDALETITAEKPLLLVLEDLHWAHASTIDFISAMARGRAPAKLMLIGTYRPADLRSGEHPLETVKQDLLLHRLAHEIALQPLEEVEVAEYLHIELKGTALPQGLPASIHRYTGGNPLFMCAVVEHMQSRGLIGARNGGEHIEIRPEKIDLEAPESLRHMIELQIERLSEEEQQVLEIASVLRKFSLSVTIAAAVSNFEPETVEELLDRLASRHQVIRSSGLRNYRTGPSPGYDFVHEMYREVLYRRIRPIRRKKLHQRVAENIEALHVLTESEVASELAEHFELGGDWLRAIKYLQFAANIAGWRFEPQQAADILVHALELVKKLPEAEGAEYQITILEELARIYIAWVRKATGS